MKSLQPADVYAFGMMSASTLHRLNTPFPQSDAYSEIGQTYRMMGGEAANSALVLARLGVVSAIRGNLLGDDPEAEQVLAIFERFGIDTSSIERRPGIQTVKEIVFSDNETRTIFGTYIRLNEAKEWSMPDEDAIMQCKLVCLDPFFEEASERTATLAGAYGKPIVTVDTPYDGTIAEQAQVVIISGEFRQSRYPERAKAELFQQYIDSTDAMVIFTSGSEPVIYAQKGGPSGTVPAFKVEVTDSAGAGDSYRSGIIYGMLQNWDWEKTVTFAGAVAAIVCTRFPGVLDAPTAEEVNAFIQAYNRS